MLDQKNRAQVRDKKNQKLSILLEVNVKISARHYSVHCFSHSVVSCSFVTPWTIALQAPLSVGFPRQEYWSVLPFPSPGDLPDPEIEPVSPAVTGRFFTTEPPGKPLGASSVLLSSVRTLGTLGGFTLQAVF